MKNILLSQQGAKKIQQETYELFYQDLDTTIKSFTPGEWCLFEDKHKNRKYLGFVNSFVENNRPCGHILKEVTKLELKSEEEYLNKLIQKAFIKRELFLGVTKNTRLIYGQADNLPGLIVDTYENITFVQINTAGLDRHREFIKKTLEQLKCPKILFLDNIDYRKGEGLPLFEVEELQENLLIKENEIRFEIRPNVMQKVGFYFDHRINRRKARKLIKLLPENAIGLDLFSYVGAWGLNFLKAGISHVDFIDQGNFEQEIKKNLELNNFSEQGTFVKSDVFSYLKNNISKKYQVICSDPPAFCKSKKEAPRAREGYVKLHTLCLKHLDQESIFIACSCTHYIGHDDFQGTVIEASKRAGRKIQLIDIGLQSPDHPMKKTNSKSSYLKYYAYYVE